MNDLHETPYFADEMLKVTNNDPDWSLYMSDSAIKREYTVLFIRRCVTILAGELDGTPHVRGVVHDKDGEVGRQNRLVMFIHFKKSKTVTLKKSIQVDLVKISPEYGKLGIVSEAYFKLAEMGFTVVSDQTQYQGGHYLWKRIASLSHKHPKCKVLIWDERKKDYFRDSNNVIIQYNKLNIEDAKIWSSGMDFSKTDIVLTLQKVDESMIPTFSDFINESVKPFLIMSIKTTDALSIMDKLNHYLKTTKLMKYSKAVINPASDEDELILNVFATMPDLALTNSGEDLKNRKTQMASELTKLLGTKVTVASYNA